MSTKPRERKKKFVVSLDASTARWLTALARSQTDLDGKPVQVTPEELLEQAAFCMADAAGKRTGSWEADVARSMLQSSGFSSEVTDYRTLDRLNRLDDLSNATHFAWWGSLTPEQKAAEFKLTGKARDDFIARHKEDAK